MGFKKTTEQNSNYLNLEKKNIAELLQGIHQEDQNAVKAVALVLPELERLIERIVLKQKNGGRLFYIGAGTSGRLGVLDASECPPTFGTTPERVIGIIAGAIQGYFGGWLDLLFQRFLEIFSALPSLYVIIILTAILGRSFWLLAILSIIFG